MSDAALQKPQFYSLSRVYLWWLLATKKKEVKPLGNPKQKSKRASRALAKVKIGGVYQFSRREEERNEAHCPF